MRGALVVVGVCLATWLWGPLVPVLLALGWLAAILGGRRFGWLARVDDAVRRTLRPRRPWRTASLTAAGLAVLVGALAVVPDGWVGIPPGAGVWVGPDYRGRPVGADPVTGVEVPQNPHLAAGGRSTPRGDAWSSDTTPGPGPLGRELDVDSAWTRLTRCGQLTVDSRGRLIGTCDGPRVASLRVIDPDSLRTRATFALPAAPGGADGCAGDALFLDAADRAVVATADRRILVVATSDGEGDPDLTLARSYRLRSRVAADDCLTAILPDWSGRLWWATRDGLVGTLDPETGTSAAYDLEAAIDTGLATGADGGVYVVSSHALYRFDAGPAGAPTVTWRAPYDRGAPGRAGQGSGTTPTLLADGRLVAITDNAEPRMNVLAFDAATGAETCRVPVFEDGASATQGSLAGVGSSVLVANTAGHASRLSTVLGRATAPGIARVDLDTCRLRWTAHVSAPSSVPQVSLTAGLAYVYAKQPTWTGVSAWYLTAVELRTGHLAFAVRTGTGGLFDNAGSPVTLATDGAAYVATRGGLVRVRDGT